MSQYILFYSEKCKYSVNFINILHKINARSYFTFVSVDRDPKTKQRHTAVQKFQIKYVPTIIINDELLVGQQALLWLKKLITDMGTSGPPAIGSRHNKDGHETSPNKMEPEEQQELSGYDPDSGNMVSIDTDLDNKISYITEDGEDYRGQQSDFQISHQSILSNEIARDLDIRLLKEGNSGNQGNEKKQRIGLKGDSFKEKQKESEFEKYRRMRDSEVSKPRQMRTN
jgi:hypothetical protein